MLAQGFVSRIAVLAASLALSCGAAQAADMEVPQIGFLAPGMVSPTRERKHG